MDFEKLCMTGWRLGSRFAPVDVIEFLYLLVLDDLHVLRSEFTKCGHRRCAIRTSAVDHVRRYRNDATVSSPAQSPPRILLPGAGRRLIRVR